MKFRDIKSLCKWCTPLNERLGVWRLVWLPSQLCFSTSPALLTLRFWLLGETVMVMTALLFSELYASSCAKCFLCVFSCNTHNKAGNSIPLVCPFFFYTRGTWDLGRWIKWAMPRKLVKCLSVYLNDHTTYIFTCWFSRNCLSFRVQPSSSCIACYSSEHASAPPTPVSPWVLC